jgi:hypothetical protein
MLAVLVAAGWLWLSFDLGRRQEKRAAEIKAAGSPADAVGI